MKGGSISSAEYKCVATFCQIFSQEYEGTCSMFRFGYPALEITDIGRFCVLGSSTCQAQPDLTPQSLVKNLWCSFIPVYISSYLDHERLPPCVAMIHLPGSPFKSPRHTSTHHVLSHADPTRAIETAKARRSGTPKFGPARRRAPAPFGSRRSRRRPRRPRR